MPWYDNADISRITDAPREGVICFDTETTGLDAGGRDEILQLSVVDGNGRGPVQRLREAGAPPEVAEGPGGQRHHARDGEGQAHHVRAPPGAQRVFSRARVLVAYNLEFDLKVP